MPSRVPARAAALALVVATLGCQTEARRIEREPFATTVKRLAKPASLADTVSRMAMPLIESGRNIGMVVAVSTPTEDGIYAFGRRDPAVAEPLRADAVFQIGSVTKSFTAVLAAALAEERKIALDAPVSGTIPAGMPVAADGLRRVTFAELASHTSGLPHEGYTLDLLWGVMSYLVSGKSLYRYFDTAVLEDYVRTYGFVRPKRRAYAYSNIGVTYLGWLLTKASGKSFGALLHDTITGPLGMTSTELSLPENGAKLTPGFAGDLPTFLSRHVPVDPWLFDDGIAASGGVQSTAADLLKYAKANIGRVPSPLFSAMEETHRGRAAAEGGEIGLAWFIKTLPRTGKKYVHIGGIVGGHTSFVGFDEDRKVAVVVLQNSINHDDMIAVDLLDRLVGAEMLKAKGFRWAQFKDGTTAL